MASLEDFESENGGVAEEIDRNGLTISKTVEDGDEQVKLKQNENIELDEFQPRGQINIISAECPKQCTDAQCNCNQFDESLEPGQWRSMGDMPGVLSCDFCDSQ